MYPALIEGYYPNLEGVSKIKGALDASRSTTFKNKFHDVRHLLQPEEDALAQVARHFQVPIARALQERVHEVP
jgi:hypothetical protein